MEAFLEFGWLMLMMATGAIVWITPYILVLLLPGILVCVTVIVANATMSWFPWNIVMEAIRWLLIIACLYLVYWSLSTLTV